MSVLGDGSLYRRESFEHRSAVFTAVLNQTRTVPREATDKNLAYISVKLIKVPACYMFSSKLVVDMTRS